MDEVRETGLDDLQVPNGMANNERIEGDRVQRNHEAGDEFDDVVSKDAINDQE